MNGYDEIISLMQTLATSFRVLPDKAAEKLNALTEEERDELLHLLKLVSSVIVVLAISGPYLRKQIPLMARRWKAAREGRNA